MQLKNYSANLTTVITNVAQSPNGYFLSSLGGYLTNLTAGPITVTLSIYSDAGALKASVPFTLTADQRLDMSNKMFLGPLETIKAICSSGTASIVLFGAETLVSAEVVPASWNWLGAWDTGTDYVPNNLVAGADGRAYIALFSNTASEPSLVNTNWGVFAAASGAVLNSDATTAEMQFVIDEDTMVSDSDTKVPTQQSVKAYVDKKAPIADPAFTGDLTCTGNITAYFSDARLKDQTGLITGAIEKVSAIDTFYYRPNALASSFGFSSDKTEVGVSAQSVETVMPEVVSRAPFDMDGLGDSLSGENYLTVDYARLVPLLIEAIKEQQKQIDELKLLVKGGV